VQWVSGECGLSQLDSYQLLSQAVESPLANVCDSNYTSLAKVRKAWLPARSPRYAIHSNLRAVASAYAAAAS
jgi:hypothetical protein